MCEQLNNKSLHRLQWDIRLQIVFPMLGGNTKDGIDLEQCAHIPLKKRSKPPTKSSRTKQFHKSSYTISKKSLEKKM
jgi:hypothetical protein